MQDAQLFRIFRHAHGLLDRIAHRVAAEGLEIFVHLHKNITTHLG